MNRVAIVAHFFPPDGGAGSQRPAKFAKYLPDYGWEPTVFTRTPESRRNALEPEDLSLSQMDSSTTKVVRVSPDPESAQQLPSFFKRSQAAAYVAPLANSICEEHRKNPFDAIMITMSPFSLSQMLKPLKRKINVPVILDLRDPWAFDGWRIQGCRRRWEVDYGIMVDSLREADGIIVNTPEVKKIVLQRVTGIRERDIEVIPNGFDARDFESTEPAPRDDRFTLVHTGSFHTNLMNLYKGVLGQLRRWRHHHAEPIGISGRTPVYLLEALSRLKADGIVSSKNFLVKALGIDNDTERLIRKSDVSDLFSLEPYLPHNVSVSWLMAADAVFLPLHTLPEGHRSLIVPGKTYEYIASGSRILAALPEGDAKDLVRRTGRATAVQPNDVDGIAKGIEGLLSMPRGRDSGIRGDDHWFEAFDRRSLTKKFSCFLAETSAATSSGR